MSNSGFVLDDPRLDRPAGPVRKLCGNGGENLPNLAAKKIRKELSLYTQSVVRMRRPALLHRQRLRKRQEPDVRAVADGHRQVQHLAGRVDAETAGRRQPAQPQAPGRLKRAVADVAQPGTAIRALVDVG